VLIIYLIIKRYKDEETAIMASYITFTCGGLFFIGGVVLLDMLLTLCTASAYLCYYAFLNEKNPQIRWRFSVAVFIMLGLSFLTKGPVGIVMFGLPVFFWTLLNRQWSTLKHHAWITGSILFLLITVPWFYLAECATPGFNYYFFINENILRFLKHDYGDLYGTGHRFPYGTAIGFMLLSALPWSLALLVFIYLQFKKGSENLKKFIFNKQRIKALFAYQSDNNNRYNYFLLGFLSITLFWCLARQLLIEYLLPAIPAFGIYIAILLKAHKVNFQKILKTAYTLLILYLIALCVLRFTIGVQRSTKYIIEDIIQNNTNNADNLQILFVRKTPNSSYFYGGKSIIPHPKQKVDDSITSGLNKDNVVFIIKKKYLKRANKDLLKSLDISEFSKNWCIMTPKKINHRKMKMNSKRKTRHYENRDNNTMLQ